MKVEKLPSGSYRIQKMIDGKRHSLTYDHEPTKKEIERDIAKLLDKVSVDRGLTFLKACKSYTDMKKNVLSPSTLRDYISFQTRISDRFLKLRVDDITQADIQLEINEQARSKSPKTVRNIHGFISAVIRVYRPDMIIHTTLPQKVKYEPKMPAKEDIIAILDMVKGSKYEIPFRLGCLGLRRSEICALTKKDLDGNTLRINKACVIDENNTLVVKTTKTVDSTREIYIPDDLAELIRQTEEKVFPGYPSSILSKLHKCQDALGLVHFRLHDLRHFYASYAHSMGMSDADIMASGGWKTDGVMKAVYRHSMKKSKEEMQKRIADSIF